MGRTLTNGMMPGQTERRLVRRDMAWVWPTTIACRAQKPRCHHVQAALRLPRQDLEKPKRRDLRQEKPSGFLSRSNGLGKHQETGKERRDAPYRPHQLHHERRAWVPIGHFRLELFRPRHSSHQGNTTDPRSFFIIIHTSIHAFIPYAHAPQMIRAQIARGLGN